MIAAFTYELPDTAYLKLKSAGIDCKTFNGQNSLKEFCKDADAVITLLSDKIDREFIEELNNCKIIANYAVGYNNIDLDAAKENGIIVTNTPGVLTNATADLTWGLILSCARRLREAENVLRNKLFAGWKPKFMLGVELAGKSIGIIGAGRIGFAVAERAKAFGMQIIYFSRKRNRGLEVQTGAIFKPITELVQIADVISVHLPLTNETKNFLNAALLRKMKKEAIFINTARGEIADEEELIKMLEEKAIFAAGIDVFINEPNIDERFYNLENVVLLPHVGSATVETRNRMAEIAAENVIEVLSGRKAINPV